MLIGYTSGVYDLFHIGHLNILRNAKSMCDKLIVGVSTDELVQEYKNKRPIINHEERKMIVSSVKYVDAVVSQESMDKIEMWRKLKFDVLVVGDDWQRSEKWSKIESDFNEFGVKVIYFPHTKGTSSTKINKILDDYRIDYGT